MDTKFENGWLRHHILWPVAVCYGHSGEDGDRGIDWSAPSDELDEVAGEATEQTWKKQVNSAGTGNIWWRNLLWRNLWGFNNHISEEFIIHPLKRQNHWVKINYV